MPRAYANPCMIFFPLKLHPGSVTMPINRLLSLAAVSSPNIKTANYTFTYTFTFTFIRHIIS